MLLSDGERVRTKRTDDEVIDILRTDFEKMSPRERECLLQILEDFESKGRSVALDVGEKEQYDEIPVPMKQWMEDDYYFGRPCEGLWQSIREDLLEIHSGDYNEVILSGAIGVGKCLSEDSDIYDINSGKRVEIKDWKSDRSIIQSFSVFGESKKTISTGHVFSGEKSCIEIVTRSGKRLICTSNHPLLTRNGWVDAGSCCGKLIATPRFVPRPINELKISDAEVVFVAYMLAEGACTSGNFGFTNFDDCIVEEFRFVATSLADFRKNDKWHQRGKAGVSEKKRGTYYPRGCKWIKRKYKELNVLSKNKRIPAIFYGLSDRQLGLFINRLFACDGWIGKSPYSVSITLASEKFIDDIQFLLLRFGIHSAKSSTPKKIKEKKFDAWTLNVLGEEVKTFFDNIGFIRAKEEKCKDALLMCNSVKHNTNVDIVPVGYEEMKEIRKDVGGISKEVWYKIRVPKGQHYGRKGFAKLCESLSLGDKWKWLVGDIYWDEAVSIKDAGKRKVYDIEVNKNRNFVANGIIVHNSTLGEISLCRQLYEIGCLRNPQRTYGLRSGSTIALVNFSVSEKLAQKVVFDAISENIKMSPWFSKNFNPERTKSELRFPKNIWVTCSSSSPHSVLGLNVIAAILDETNFMGELSKEQRSGYKKWEHIDNAQILYTSIKRRIKSRFEMFGRLPGILLLISSKRTVSDFTERRILEASDERHVFVSERSLWEAKPERYEGALRFKVIVGNENFGSRIVRYDEDLVEAKEKECRVIDVPVDFKSDFEKDLDQSLRDLAGVATESVYPFIRKREKIEECIDLTAVHPCVSVQWVFGEPLEIQWERLVRKTDGVIKPLQNPNAVRHIHIDPSLTGDSAGFAVGHIESYVNVRRRDVMNEMTVERAPFIVIDFLLKIIPPPGGEIVIAELRNLVYEFHEHGFSIGFVSMDSYIKADPIQILSSKGFKAAHVSMDLSVIPYQTLKDCLYDNRLRMYRYDPVITELRELEYSVRKKKVDHREDSSKDVSDSLAGVVYTLSNSSYAEMPISMYSQSFNEDAIKGKIQEVIKKSSVGRADPLDMLISDDEDARDVGSQLIYPGDYL